jgi:hypothetical protein
MNEILPLLIDRLDTPIGEMLIVSDREENLRAVEEASCVDTDCAGAPGSTK